MCWIPESPRGRRTAAALALSAGVIGAFGGGCSQQPPHTVTRPPLVVDEAMQRREFERSVAYYPNGDTVSGVNRFIVRSDLAPGESDAVAGAFDIAASIGQSIALPFTYIFIPPGTRAVYHGEDIPPTYTAMPEMRPPATLVNVGGGIEVDPDTLEVRKVPEAVNTEDYHRHGATSMTDTDVDTRQTTPPPAQKQQQPEWE